MRFSIRQYATGLLVLEKELGTEKAREGAVQFLAWLSRRGEGKKIAKIIRATESMLREEQGVVKVRVTTAHERNEATERLLKKQAQEVFAPKRVEASFVTDSSLIGGVRIESDEVLYDNTLRAAVRQLQTSLVK